MAKVNYTKAEEAFEQAMRQHAVDQMLEETLWKNLAEGTLYYRGDDRNTAKTDTMIEHILVKVQTQLKLIKESDEGFYGQMGITPSDEKKFFGSTKELIPADWQRLKKTKDLIDHYEPPKSNEETTEDVEQIQSQQKEHRHKRYNVKKGWLPL